MRLVLGLTPSSVEFTEANSGGALPYLLTIGTLRMAARTGTQFGIGATENATLSVTLDNPGRQASAILRRPLRAAAEVYSDDGALFFSGTVASIEYGRTVLMDLEA